MTATTMTKTATDQTRFRDAMKTLRKELRAKGGNAKMNVRECCKGCVTAEKLGVTNDDAPVAWTYGGQGMALRFDSHDGRAYQLADYGWDRKRYNPTAMFNHSGKGVAQLVVDVFTDAGFDVEWDGNQWSCVAVKF